MTEKAVDTMFEKASELPEYSETTRPCTYFKSGFRLGYHQAEKDLALTWEDVKLIWNITDEMDNMPEEEFYQEVLKRFKNLKEK